MSTHSDEALQLAGKVTEGAYFTRVAASVAATIRYCALEGCALDDDQCEQLYRATLEAGDGVLEQVALVIDEYWSHRLLGTIEEDA